MIKCLRLSRRSSITYPVVSLINDLINSRDAKVIDFNEACTSYSQVKIETTREKVMICKNGKCMELIQALSNYLHKLGSGEVTIHHSKVKFSDPAESQELLKNSTIMDVWCLPESRLNKDLNKRIIGAAKNNVTGKVFHWVTNLGNEIEMLLKDNTM